MMLGDNLTFKKIKKTNEKKKEKKKKKIEMGEVEKVGASFLVCKGKFTNLFRGN
jgi:hypothetical protein